MVKYRICITLLSLSLLTLPVLAGKKNNDLDITEKVIKIPKICQGKEPLISKDGNQITLKYLHRKKSKKVNEAYYTILKFNENMEQLGDAAREDISIEKLSKFDEGTLFFAQSGKWAGFSLSGISTVIKILNPNLFFYKVKYTTDEKGKTLYWNNAKNEYSSKTPEPSPINGVSLEGFRPISDYRNFATNEIAVIGYREIDKSNRVFEVIFVDTALNARSVPLPLDGRYSVVYTSYVRHTDDDEDENLNNSEMFFILAPGPGSVDVTKFKCIRMNASGEIVAQFDLQSPSASLAVGTAWKSGEDLILFALSEKTKKCFEDEFQDGQYSTISGAWGTEGAYTKRMSDYQAHLRNADYHSLHIITIGPDAVKSISDNPVKSIKELGKLKPNYGGEPVIVSSLAKDPSTGDIWVGLQHKDFTLMNKFSLFEYKNTYLFRFDPSGKLVASYGSPRQFDGKKDMVYSSDQNQIFNKAGTKILWSIKEPKFSEAVPSFSASMGWGGTVSLYYTTGARVTVIDKATGTSNKMVLLGKNKYFLYKNANEIVLPEGNSMVFFGSDKKFKNLWIGKVTLK